MKTVFSKIVVINLLVISSTLYAEEDIFDDSLEDLLSMETELKADLGSRSGSKNFLDSPVPLDVITYKQIERSGLTSLTDILRYFVAGFNAPETSIADGSDHIRTFTLRGMKPDQILVLINGKRLHTSALLNVNGTIGRGSSNVDLDTIAPISIEKIEILRDGAAAQYGSDAIAGVINIILKKGEHKNSISAHYGQRKEGDGKALVTDAFITTSLPYDGFINISLQAKQQEQTNRAGYDNRLDIPAITSHVGIADSSNYLALLNSEIPLKNSMVLYTNALVNYRDSEAGAFFRPSSDSNPNGFLPLINAKILDYSLTTGVNGEFGDALFWDMSNVYGHNQIKYYMNDSQNYSLGETSPSSFYNGSLAFTQNTTNFDLKKSFNNFTLAGGAEYRYESYTIESGDKSSYIDGGSQGFSGYQDINEVDKSRHNYALYIDSSYNITEDILVQGAGRFEEYSDFGSTTNAKLAFSYKIIDEVLLRASTSTGFRAPSLAQSLYSHTSSFGGLIEGTFSPDNEVSKLFGAKPLTAEKSKHFTMGTVYQPTQNISFMVDYFYTEVEDIIELSNEFTLSDEQQSKYNVNSARFFTNAGTIKTEGVDIKYNQKIHFENSASLELGAWFNYNKNKILDIQKQLVTDANIYKQIVRVEDGEPKNRLKLLTTYSINDLETTLNISRYGAYAQVRDAKAYWFNPAWTTDLDISYKIAKDIKISMGGNNILDTIPNRWNGLTYSADNKYYGSDSIKPYSRYSPFGYSGAYYYMKVNIEF